MSTYKEPFPGWTDNINGPSNLCCWAARGFIRCIYGNGNFHANMVPVDYCVNAMIASAWDVALRYSYLFYTIECINIIIIIFSSSSCINILYTVIR